MLQVRTSQCDSYPYWLRFDLHPADSEGLWINKPVANVLNDKDCKKIKAGFISQLYNSRGVHSVDPVGAPNIN